MSEPLELSPPTCDCAETERNLKSRFPMLSTSITEDGEIVCRFCWEVLNRDEFSPTQIIAEHRADIEAARASDYFATDPEGDQ